MVYLLLDHYDIGNYLIPAYAETAFTNELRLSRKYNDFEVFNTHFGKYKVK